MNRKTRFLFVALLLSALALPIGAQTEDAPERSIDLAEVRTLREQAEANTALSVELQVRILELYDGAVGSLEAVEVKTAAAATADRERAGVGRIVESLRRELQRPERRAQLGLPQDPTVEQAEDALAEERARLNADRSALRDVERLAEERANSRIEIPQRLGALDQELEQLEDELRNLAQRDAHPEFKRAARFGVLARKEAALSEIRSLRASRSLLEAKGALIPLQVDQAQRRVVYSEQSVALHEEAARTLRRQGAEESLQEVREQSQSASELAPELAEIAAETRGFAELLWGPRGAVLRSEEAVKALLTTRKHISDLDRITILARRKYEAFGHRGAITRWWPEFPKGFPGPGDAAATIRRLDEEIPELEHRLITFEQQRSTAHELAQRIYSKLRAQSGEELEPELTRTVRDLLSVRRELLDQLIQHYGQLSSQLVRHRTVSLRFLDNREQIERFLFSQVLWARSVPRPALGFDVVSRSSGHAPRSRTATATDPRWGQLCTRPCWQHPCRCCCTSEACF
jgi:hypothetical protein